MIKLLFVLGLALQVGAQALLAAENGSPDLVEPVDVIHWMMLLGYVAIIPYTLRFASGVYQGLGGTLAVLGIVCFIGMCVVDLVLWVLRMDPAAQRALAQTLSAEPQVWTVFVTIGPSLLFVGLCIQALAFYSERKLTVLFTLFSALLLGLSDALIPDYRMVHAAAYASFAMGIIWLALRQADNEPLFAEYAYARG